MVPENYVVLVWRHNLLRNTKVNALDKNEHVTRTESLLWLVTVICNDMQKNLDAYLKQIGLNINLWPTLFALWEQDGLTQSELTIRCNTAHYTTTRVLNHLEANGLVQRHLHPKSKRSHLVYLTEKAQLIKSQALASARTCNAEFLSHLSQSESELLISALQKLASRKFLIL